MSCLYFLSLIFYLFICLPCFVKRFALAATGKEECPNIRTAGTGTVLFNPTDIYKTCWSQDEIAILTARLILEDVIPEPKFISVQCNDDVEDLVEYFKVVIDTIRSNTKGRKRHIMLMALTDLLGGYLHHAVLPMARKAYYAGAVDYVYMEKLIQLYEELKWFLRTNGQGWTKPLIITKEVRVPIIDQVTHKDQKQNESCCRKLLFYEHEPIKRKKRAVTTEKGIYFPLPFFDAKFNPTAIVVPLKRYGLRNIESKRSAYVVMKYFISAEQCLKEKNANSELLQRFRNSLYTWIDKEVIPKLGDDKFYSAFGGILRVQSTLKALGARTGPVTCNTDEGEEEVGAVPAVGCTSKRNKVFLIAMLIIIIAWFLIGTCFICYRMKNGKSSKTGKSDEKKTSKPGSSTSFSSSKWSSILSRSSSKSSKSNKQLCKCCESTISEKSTADFTSTSEYDSEKSRKKDKKKSKLFGYSYRKTSQSSPCICPNDGPAIIDAKHSMKVLPSIAEMSENSLSKDKNDSMKRISFADESGISSSDGGMKPCAPPWAQTKNTIPCPILSDKSTNYSSSRSTTTKSQGVPNSSHIPLASSTKYEPTQLNQSYRTNVDSPTQLNQSYRTNVDSPMPPNQSYRTNADSSMPPNQSYRTNVDSPMQPNQSYRTNADSSMPLNQSYRTNVDSPMPLNQSYRTKVDSPMPLNQSYRTNVDSSRIADVSGASYEDQQNMSLRNIASDETFENRKIRPYEVGPPLANSTLRYEPTERTDEYEISNTPGEESYQKDSNNSIQKRVSTSGTVEEYSNNEEEEEEIPPTIKKEPEDKKYYDYHMSACHSSLSGNYDLFHKPDPNKPYIFGYDFQTSTSSDMSDDDDSKY